MVGHHLVNDFKDQAGVVELHLTGGAAAVAGVPRVVVALRPNSHHPVLLCDVVELRQVALVFHGEGVSVNVQHQWHVCGQIDRLGHKDVPAPLHLLVVHALNVVETLEHLVDGTLTGGPTWETFVLRNASAERHR